MRTLGRSTRTIAALAVWVISAFAQAADLAVQQPKVAVGDPNRIVSILQEPRHRIVHRDGDVYVLDIQINPGDMTLQHTHDAAILYTFISTGAGPAGGRLSANTDYVAKHFTHQVSNEGPGLFRIIALTNYGPPVTGGTSDRPIGMNREPDVENPWLRGYSITLEPGESTDVQKHRNPSLIVQTNDGRVHVTRDDGMTAELDSIGSWTWRNADSTYRIRNVGPAPVKIAINEARGVARNEKE